MIKRAPKTGLVRPGLRVELATKPKLARPIRIDDGHRHRYNLPVAGSHPDRRICVHCGHSESVIRKARRAKKQTNPERWLSETDRFIFKEYTTFGAFATNGATAYSIIYRNKQGRLATARTHHGGCFGGISYSLSDAKRQGELVALIIASGNLTNPRYNWRTAPEMQEYVDWLINHSPYRYAFLDKDPADVMKYGSRMNLRMSTKYLVSAGVGLRYIMEKPYVVENWHRLRPVIGPTLGLFFAQIHLMDGAGSATSKYFTDKERKYHPANSHWNSGHCIFSSDLSLTGLRRYLSTDLSKEFLLPSVLESSEYRGRMRTWNDGDHFKNERNDVVILNKGRRERVKVEWAYQAIEKTVLDITTLPELAKEFVTKNQLEEFVNEDLAKESRHRSR